MPSIDELLRAALPTGTKVRAGAVGLGREVSWVTRLRARTPAFEHLSPGEVALVPVATLQALEQRPTLRHVVEQLGAAGMAGVVAIGDVDSAALAAAERLALPLLQAPIETNPEALELELQRWILERRTVAYHERQRLQRQLAEFTLQGAGLRALVEHIARLRRKPTFVHDARWKVRFGYMPPDSAIPEELAHAALHMNAAELAAWARQDRQEIFDSGVGYFDLPEARLTRLVAPISRGRAQDAYMSILARAGDLTEIDRFTILAGASAAAIELAREDASATTRDELTGDLLESLLGDDFRTEEAFRSRAKRLGHDLELPHAALALRRPQDAHDQVVTGVIYALTPGIKPIVRAQGDSVLALIPTEPDSASLAIAARAWHRVIRGRLGPASVGLSGPVQGATALRRALNEAMQALAMGERVFGPDRLTPFGDLTLFRLLLSADSAALRQFHETVLGALVAYDRARKTELVATLGAYFACRCSPQDTAARLGLHRNSLLYRLRRIGEIASVDLQDAEVRLQLHLALRVGQACAVTNESCGGDQ